MSMPFNQCVLFSVPATQLIKVISFCSLQFDQDALLDVWKVWCLSHLVTVGACHLQELWWNGVRWTGYPGGVQTTDSYPTLTVNSTEGTFDHKNTQKHLLQQLIITVSTFCRHCFTAQLASYFARDCLFSNTRMASVWQISTQCQKNLSYCNSMCQHHSSVLFHMQVVRQHMW